MNAELLPWVGAALLAVLAVATAEGLVMSWRQPGSYDWRAYFATVGDVIGRRAIDALGLSLAAPVVWWAWEHRIATQTLDTATAFAVLFIGQEFCYYWYHRAAHRVRWFWASHAVHHSPNQLTLAAAVRLGWTGKLTGTALFFTPLMWLGFAPLAVFGVVALNLLYQFWVHATWIPKLGPLEWVLNTPSHHRVHHASNPEYLDCNYGGVLIVFDRLFGTFVEERADIAPRYGLTKPLHSYNPVRIALHEWVNLARDVAAAHGWKARLATVLGPPGGAGTAPRSLSTPSAVAFKE
jgi:sterol desaturase/sphingolipid hydroxylase (fatty acid hydroxylase superfamily)